MKPISKDPGWKRTKNSYDAMHSRVRRPDHRAYRWYGGRGITICDRWMGPEGLRHFIEDMGYRPDGYSLDREDPKGNYEKANCRWMPKGFQQQNRRNTRYVLFEGQRVRLAELIERFGICKKSSIYARLRRGWSVYAALTVPAWGGWHPV